VYEVLLARAAERDLKSLLVQIFQRILPRIKSLVQNPRPSGCHKLSGSRNDWRIRVGDYRIIYEIKERAKVVRVMRFATAGRFTVRLEKGLRFLLRDAEGRGDNYDVGLPILNRDHRKRRILG